MLLSTGLAVRLACRRRALNPSTAGVAPGHVQGNPTIFPKGFEDALIDDGLPMRHIDLQHAQLAVRGERKEDS